MITFGRPLFLYLILLLIPALFWFLHFSKKILKAFGNFSERKKENAEFVNNIFFRIRSRTCCWSLAYLMLVIAIAQPFYGSRTVPVQKNGSAVALVFDISYSMNAKDMPMNSTRLGYAAAYAYQLLDKMQNIPVSVILTKGISITAIPQTNDYNSIFSLLQKLSPGLISAPGSDIASGIDCALQTFLAKTAQTSAIILFTDGDETQSSLKDALQKALDYGVSVTIVGVGSTNTTSVLTGDGIQYAETALQEEKIKNICAQLQKKEKRLFASREEERICYVNAQETSSAVKVLQRAVLVKNTQDDNTDSTLGQTFYEIQQVPHQNLFLCLALCLFIAGVIISELRFSKKIMQIFCLIPFAFFLGSCSKNTEAAVKIFSGVIFWGQGNYRNATASFIDAQQTAELIQDEKAADYAQYGLAVTYLMQGETTAAGEKFEHLLTNTDLEEQLRFGTAYNCGIIAYQDGDYTKAAEYFKQALLIDSNSIYAKINLELSNNQILLRSRAAEQEIIPVQKTTDSTVQDIIFSVIKENEQNQWKNQPKTNDSSVLDY